MLINDDNTLRKFLPNAFATAKGETPFYERVLPWLRAAERWLFTQFVGDDFADSFLSLDDEDPMRLTASALVVHETFMRAVPSLDLVLTPNGFGIVSNQNVAPASRDRVARLLASLETSRDNAIEQLLGYLFRNEEWYHTSIRLWFTGSLFPNIDLANLCGITEKRWANYLSLRSKAIDIEMRIADEFISPAQLVVFREEVLGINWSFSLADRLHQQVIEQLRAIVVSVLQGNALNIQALRDIVDLMRKHEEQFVEFAASETVKLFSPPIFENKKDNNGYWF